MPQLIPMVALVAFDRNGKTLKAGDEFSALPIEAASLNFNKKASFASAPPRSQALGTRSMTAAPIRPSAPAAEPTGGTGRRRGGRATAAGGASYDTRDMAAPSGDKD